MAVVLFCIFDENQEQLLKKTQYIVLVLIAILFACTKKNLINQSSDISNDSLVAYLSKANDFNSSNKKRQDYTTKAYAIIQDQPNDSISRVNLFRVANRYYNLNDWGAYKNTVKVALEKSLDSKDSVSTAKAYSYLGEYYGSQGVSDTAYSYYFKAEKIFLQLKDNYNLAKTRLNKALLQFNEGDIKGSEISVFKGLQVLKKEESNDIIYELYNLLGAIYTNLEDYDNALEFYKKALATIDDKTSPIEYQYKATSLNNIGLVYQITNQNRLAIPYFEKGLEYEKNLLLYKPFVYAKLLNNLAYSRFKVNESKGLPGLFYKSLKISDSLRLTGGVIEIKVNLSDYYFTTIKDTVKAMQFSHEALTTARETKNPGIVLFVLKQIAKIDFKKAAAYNNEYIHINDSLQKAERNTAYKFSRIEYETDEIKQENTDLTTQNRNLVYIFGSVLILGMFLYIIKAQKAKNRELLYKQEQQKANEEIYNLMISQQSNVETIRVKEKKRVAQELHDGVLGRMFGVRMNLDSLNKIHDESASVQRNSYLTELKNIEQDIREISHDLNREKSELINNFVAIVDNLFEEQKKTFSTKLVSNIDSTIKWETISNAVKINLYRIVQESLQNINKYANASIVKIEFKKETDNLFLQISDDGIGFNVNRGKKGIGLQNMVSRINECKGTFEIKSKKGDGTIITVTVPI